ncbi:hypothetical protein [Aeromicrobium sp.]|uniref:hypothetical protein n=1 Tax=Aeromicrobium sp. TaxID=1871063 RepID=UPI0019C4D22B|nr:hypothetical protein [Aeromicrobium sp.]MBC7630640.1 hypothetical protein [Aeromicrobium sp.]
MKGRPHGFEWTVRGKEVVISHHGKVAMVLRGEKARQFAQEAENTDPQLLMARLTGNYSRDNERIAKNHPRNH